MSSEDSGQNNNYEILFEIIEKFKGAKGSLIPILQEVQKAYGYLSQDIILRVGQSLNIPASQIYGVVTFYSQFHLNPRGKNIIRVCQGTACHVRGAKSVLQAIEDQLQITAGETTEDLQYTIENIACIGACGLAPVIMVNDDTHGRLKAKDIPDLLEKY